MATTYQRLPGMARFDDAGEQLRVQKLHSSKGIGLLTAMFASLAVIIAVTFWMAQGLAPEPEASEGALRGQPDVPADRVEDPRAIE